MTNYHVMLLVSDYELCCGNRLNAQRIRRPYPGGGTDCSLAMCGRDGVAVARTDGVCPVGTGNRPRPVSTQADMVQAGTWKSRLKRRVTNPLDIPHLLP